MANVIEAVFRDGGRLDAWTDYFRYERWNEAFKKCGVERDFYASRERDVSEVLPWDVIDVGVRKPLLIREKERAYRSELSPDCRKSCSACGAAALLKGAKCDE